MSTITPIRIPVRNADNLIIERVDSARARCILQAPNATAVYERKGSLVGIKLADAGDDSAEVSQFGNPRKYTFAEILPSAPQGIHQLRHLPRSTANLYRLSVTDCLKRAA